MVAQLKLPAYGKRLLLDRRAGKHPLEITLVYGERWFEAEHPKICLKPADYEPGKYDFRVVAGCKVIVLDQDAGALDCDESARPITFGKFFSLLRELAESDAYVEVRWPKKIGWSDSNAQLIALSQKHFDRGARRMTWPGWWSDHLDDKQTARYYLHVQDIAVAHGHLKREDFGQIRT